MLPLEIQRPFAAAGGEGALISPPMTHEGWVVIGDFSIMAS